MVIKQKSTIKKNVNPQFYIQSMKLSTISTEGKRQAWLKYKREEAAKENVIKFGIRIRVN